MGSQNTSLESAATLKGVCVRESALLSTLRPESGAAEAAGVRLSSGEILKGRESAYSFETDVHLTETGVCFVDI